MGSSERRHPLPCEASPRAAAAPLGAGAWGQPGLCLGSGRHHRAAGRSPFLSCLRPVCAPPERRQSDPRGAAALLHLVVSMCRQVICGSCLSIFQVAVPCCFWKRGLFPSCLQEAARSASGRAWKEKCERNGVFLHVLGAEASLERGWAPRPARSLPGTWGGRVSSDLSELL